MATTVTSSPSAAATENPSSNDSTTEDFSSRQVPERLFYLSAREKDKLIKRSGKLAFGRCVDEVSDLIIPLADQFRRIDRMQQRVG